MEELFEQLQDDTRSFWQSPSAGVRHLDNMPSSSDFFRDYVATSTPVVISGGSSTCLKASRGAWDDLPSLAGRSGVGDLEVTVDFTPDGRGDCVVDVPRSMLSRLPANNGVSSHASRSDAAGRVSAKVDVSKPASAAAAAEAKASRDAGATAVFVKPEERRMKFETFLGMMLEEGGNGNPCGSGAKSGGGQGIPYLSHQVSRCSPTCCTQQQ